MRAINEQTLLLNEQELQELLNEPAVWANLIAHPSPAAENILEAVTIYDEMARVNSPFGDGQPFRRIYDELRYNGTDSSAE